MSLSIEQKAAFFDLATRMSPEHLYADANIDEASAGRIYRQLKNTWRDLERDAGLRVSEFAVWAWADEVRRWQEERGGQSVTARPAP